MMDMNFPEKLICFFEELKYRQTPHGTISIDSDTRMYKIYALGFNTRTEGDPKDPSIKTILCEILTVRACTCLLDCNVELLALTRAKSSTLQ